MAIAVERYNQLGKMIAHGAFTGTLKMMLVDNTYIYDAAHTALASVSGDEIVGAGYTAGGATLASVVIASDASGFSIDAADVTWTGLTGTFRRAIVYNTATIDAVVSPILISYLLDNTPGDISVSATDWTVAINASGLVSVTWS